MNRKEHALPEAEASFRRALDIARRQQARSLELRAAISLARLWSEQGERRDARDLLAPVYGGFGEGFDTADLTDAKGLLHQLEALGSAPAWKTVGARAAPRATGCGSYAARQPGRPAGAAHIIA